MAQRGRPRKNVEVKTEPVSKLFPPVKETTNSSIEQYHFYFTERESIKFNLASTIVKLMVEKSTGKVHADMVPNALKLAEGLIVGCKQPVGDTPKPGKFTDGPATIDSPDQWLNDDEDDE